MMIASCLIGGLEIGDVLYEVNTRVQMVCEFDRGLLMDKLGVDCL